MQVYSALEPALQRVINKTKDGPVRDVLKDLRDELHADYAHDVDAEEEDYLCGCREIADHLCSEGVMGWEKPHIRWKTDDNTLYIVVVNFELVEEGTPANYESHEDFHAYIATEIVKQCTVEGFNRTGEACLEGGDATLAILLALNDEAQSLYDMLSEDGALDNNRAAAKEAVSIVVGDFFGS